jgi:hypothetical protein
VDLAALEDIRRLKYRYLRALDLKRWDEFSQTLLPQATADYGQDLRFGSRAEIVQFMKDSLTPGIITFHQCHHPEIDIDGDSATGTWYLEDKVIVSEHRLILTGAAFYFDRYVRGADGSWRIGHTSYERTYEMTVSMDDLPSLKVTAGPALTHRPETEH